MTPTPWRGDLVPGLIIGMIVATTAISLLMSTARSTDWRILGLLGATWIFGVLVTGLDAEGGRPLAHRLVVVAGASLGWSGVFLFVLAYVRQAHLVASPFPVFVFLTASLLVVAIVHGASGSPARATWDAWLLLIALELSALWPGYRLAVAPMLADTSARFGKAWLDKQEIDRAIPPLRNAVRLAPWNDHYAGMLAGTYLDKAKAAVPPEPWLRRSETLLLDTIRQNPLMARYPLGLSALHVLWADLGPARRSQHLDESRQYAFRALGVDPVRSRPEVERQITAILLRQGMAEAAATAEAKRLVRDSARNR